MTNGAASSVFLDTNVLVYSTLASSPLNMAARAAIQTHLDAGTEVWISRQVLREYLSAVSKLQLQASPLSVAIWISDVHIFAARFNVAEDNAVVTENLLTLLAQVLMGGKHIHDANIVATMLVYGITDLLTHNVGDFTRFSQYITVVPL